MEVDTYGKHPQTNAAIHDRLNYYRPRSAEDMIAHDRIISLFSTLVHNRSRDTLLLHGPKGCGKTSAAMLIMDASTELLVEDANRESGPRQIHAIAQFSSRTGDGMGMRVCVIENVERLTPDVQIALADHVKRCRKACCFIATARDLRRVDQSLLLSLRPIKFALPRKGNKLRKKLAQRIEDGLVRAGLPANQDRILDCVDDYYPDLGVIVKVAVGEANYEHQLSLDLAAKRAARRGSTKSKNK